MRRTTTTVITAALLVAATSAQSTIVVQGGGQAFARAVAAASPGDTLLVRPGSYASTIITKGLRVLCDTGVVFQNNLFGPGFYVQRVPAGEPFILRGGIVRGSVHASHDAGAWNCAGPVLFDGVRFETAENRFESDAELAFRDCTIGTLELIDCTASFAECTIQGGGAGATAALLVSGGDVSLIGGSVTGYGFLNLIAVPAILVGRGTLHLAGDATTRIAAISNGPSAPAIEVGGFGRLRLHPAVTLVPANSPPITGAGSVERLPLPSVEIRGAVVGQTMTADLQAEPGSYSAVFLSWRVTPLVFADFGPLWIAPEAPLMFAGTVPASGILTATTGVPAVVADTAVVAQALSITAGQRLLIGPPTAFVVR